MLKIPKPSSLQRFGNAKATPRVILEESIPPIVQEKNEMEMKRKKSIESITSTTSSTTTRPNGDSKNEKSEKVNGGPSMLTRGRTKRPTRMEAPKKVVKAASVRSRSVKAPTRTVVRKDMVAASVVVPELHQDEDIVVENVHDLITKYFTTEKQEDIEAVLKERIKAGKFNMKGKVDELTVLVKRMRLLLKTSLDEVRTSS